MPWWSAHIEMRGDGSIGMTDDEFGERLDDLLVALKPHHGSVAGGGQPTRWAATISVEAATALAAIAEATAIIRGYASDVFLPGWPVVRAEAVREDVLDEDLARPSTRVQRSGVGELGACVNPPRANGRPVASSARVSTGRGRRGTCSAPIVLVVGVQARGELSGGDSYRLGADAADSRNAPTRRGGTGRVDSRADPADRAGDRLHLVGGVYGEFVYGAGVTCV